MAVFRVERTRDYTVMSNYHLKDTGLTLKAKGLLSMMLSRGAWPPSARKAWRRLARPSGSWKARGI